jgi:hypothetical protein
MAETMIRRTLAMSISIVIMFVAMGMTKSLMVVVMMIMSRSIEWIRLLIQLTL